MPFFCHRWDCPGCKEKKLKKIIDKVKSVDFSYWFVKEISENEYSAVCKRVKRAGSAYCAIGHGQKILLMTPNLVFEDSRCVLSSRLEAMIEAHLDCEYEFRTRRFRHSRGLFPPEPKSEPFTHIKSQIAVSKSANQVIDELITAKYQLTGLGDETYLRPSVKSMPPEDILSDDIWYAKRPIIVESSLDDAE